MKPFAQCSFPAAAKHLSAEIGDILHMYDGEAYVITGVLELGMPVREVTFHVEKVEKENDDLFGRDRRYPRQSKQDLDHLMEGMSGHAPE